MGAGSEELNHSFLGSRSVITTGVIAAIITIAVMFGFKANKQRVSTEGFGHFSVDALRCFSFDEILTATKNFSPTSYIGYRGCGKVYAGLINEGNTVAIKRLSFKFWEEVNVLPKLRHSNLVSLIGYCNESREMILVYEFMPLGTLAYNLCMNTSLSWEKRLRICIGAARGLDYLHTGTDHGVIHGDLKSSSILLDENYKPKIPDFGLTKIEETVLQDRNVANHTSQQLAQSSDVCSFGVVLLEVLCGETSEDSRDQESQAQLISWARNLTGDGHIEQKVDPHLDGEISPECLNAFVVMSEKCLHDDPNKRPTMVQLVAWLERLLDYHVSRESNPRMVRESNIFEAPRGNAEPKMREASSGKSSSIRPKPTESSYSNEELMFSD